MGRQLGPGDPFPAYTVSTVDGRAFNMPADIQGEYAVVTYYRGIW